VIAGVNVVAADTTATAEREFHLLKRARVNAFFGRGGRTFTDEEAEQVLASEGGRQIEQMVTYSAVGTPSEVRDYLEQFVEHADADELIIAHQSTSTEGRLRSVELTSDAMASATV
jgi:alkanesulfonate monooxygenase SsuD/methylene tetrahydromethanopterin reductase-like flavin-dependent oxidoreductase (luciferase family)